MQPHGRTARAALRRRSCGGGRSGGGRSAALAAAAEQAELDPTELEGDAVAARLGECLLTYYLLTTYLLLTYYLLTTYYLLLTLVNASFKLQCCRKHASISASSGPQARTACHSRGVK